ncbi:glycosyltransferase [Geodermatophilus sp. SYSU D00691]
MIRSFSGALTDRQVDELVSAPRERPTRRPTGTVVVCTRNRRDALARCLISLAALVPGDPLDVLIVDNGNGDDATRGLVESYGFRWVHEPEPGLDRARNRGLLEATGEVVLFADDDVYVQPTWAHMLLRCFDDPLVGAATGLVLPAVLDTEEQRVFEEHFGFGRGHHRRVMDGSLQAPTGAGSLGAGASMALRRDLMLDFGGFPEVLDGGMPTRGGGDTYGLYRVIRAGYRGVFEPRALSLHWHRPGGDELLRTVTGYSIGTYSYLLYALLHDRDPLALRALGSWSVGWVGRRLARAALHRDGAPPLHLAWAEVIGAAQTPHAYVEARRIVRHRGTLLVPRAGLSASVPAPSVRQGSARTEPISGPPVSVVIPTRNRRDSVIRLVRALDAQQVPAAEIVVVVDGDVDGTAAAVRAVSAKTDIRLKVHPTNRGAAAARNTGLQQLTGAVVLFLDDDVAPATPDLVAEHAAAHGRVSAGAAVVGPCLPGEVSVESPFLLGVRNWWIDHVGRLSSGGPLAFTDLGTGNVSISRAVLQEVGGFRELPRREDWELGYRLLRAGVHLVSAPEARVVHPIDVSLQGLLHDRLDEGAGDLRFAQDHPEVAHLLPLWSWLDMDVRRRSLVTALFLAPDVGERAIECLRPLLVGLNSLGARTRFHRRLGTAITIAYWTGIARSAGSEAAFLQTLAAAPAWSPSRIVKGQPFELRRPRWGTPDPEAVVLNLTWDGRDLARVPNRWGGFPWSDEELARRIRTGVPLERLASLLHEVRR